MATGRLGALLGLAIGMGSIATLIRQRRRSQKKPAGLADADLSEDERRRATSRLGRLWRRRGPGGDAR